MREELLQKAQYKNNEEREEINSLHAQDGNICCIEEHLTNDEG